MLRLGSVFTSLLVIGVLGCSMDNPAFDQRDQADADESQDGKAELGDAESGDEANDTKPSGDGDGEPSGDGDGEPSGDGDGEPSGDGDGDGEPSGDGDGDGDPSGDGDGDGDDPNTSDSESGDGDGDPMMNVCPALIGNDECQVCAGQHCCFPGIETCFTPGGSCKCILDCMAQNLGLEQCANQCQAPNAAALAQQADTCLQSNCPDPC